MDDDQQFCLRWNNHQSTLVSVFDTLLEKGMHVDCTLAAEGQTLKAHKVVLSACSPYFENVLSQQFDKHPIIILKDVKYAELRAMMDYMYRGEVNISQDQLAALLKAAESLQIKGLSDNKPSRPPSRPAPPAPPAPHAHPPRLSSPAPQIRDGSVDSREGSASPTRRRKKARRMSAEPPAPHPAALPPAAPPSDSSQGAAALDEPHCKQEAGGAGAGGGEGGVEDLTLDEEADDPPNVTHNDVVRNFQWHMERSQDELMNSNDSIRDSQEVPVEVMPCILDTYTMTPHALTRGFLRRLIAPRNGVYQVPVEVEKPPRAREPSKKGGSRKGRKKIAKNKNVTEAPAEPKRPIDELTECAFACSACSKRYKYKRNLLRHAKYECGSEPQFCCEWCGRRYSQKKTLKAHVALKHCDL